LLEVTQDFWIFQTPIKLNEMYNFRNVIRCFRKLSSVSHILKLEIEA